MEELQDYSGEFSPNRTLMDFSKEALIRLWIATAKLYIGIDGYWFTLIKEKYGYETAIELENELWKRAAPMEFRRVAEAMNIRGNDVASLFKALQMDPGSEGVMDLEYELKDKNHGIFTVRGCRSLEYWEKYGDTQMMKDGCAIDVWAFAEYARFFNPRMKTTCLKLPPRNSPDEIACQWEFKVEE